MKLVSYSSEAHLERVGLLLDDRILDLWESAAALEIDIPFLMAEFLWDSDANIEKAKKVEQAFNDGKIESSVALEEVTLLPPVPTPTSCRDAYAFRQHVATARRNRGLEMIPEFDQFPVFYFTNHNAIIGSGDLVVEQDHLEKLDFELEIAAVIGRAGKNITAAEADNFIAGLAIMNDFSARLLQMEEMKLNLGPAKGKDFATALGPYLVTMDELERYKVETDAGNKYDLKMSAHHNGKQISSGNMKDMDYTFAEIIERVSYGVEVFPGDVIGSGTVGTGCYLELNGTWALEAKEKDEPFEPIWLKEGDEIVLEVTGLGRLSNRIVRSENHYSILSKKRVPHK